MTKRSQWTVAAGIILGGALCVAAQAAPTAQVSQSPKVMKPVHPQIPPFKPDLTCSIAVFRDAAGTQAIPPGGSVMSGSGTVFAFVRVSVKNEAALAKAEGASAKLVSSSGTPTSVMLPAVTIAGGGSHAWSLQKITYGATSADVTLTATADPNNNVKESKEDNNTCTFSFREQTVH